MKQNNYLPYPKADRTRSGCKVSWMTYHTKEEAEECAEAARHNAEIASAQGYDFGYQWPGSIIRLEDGRFEVVIP